MALGGLSGPLFPGHVPFTGGPHPLQGAPRLLPGELGEIFAVTGGQIPVFRRPYPVDGGAAAVARRLGRVEQPRVLALLSVTVSLFGCPIPLLRGQVTHQSPLVYQRGAAVLGCIAFVRAQFTLVGDPFPFVGGALALVGKDIPSVRDYCIGYLIMAARHTHPVIPSEPKFFTRRN